MQKAIEGRAKNIKNRVIGKNLEAIVRLHDPFLDFERKRDITFSLLDFSRIFPALTETIYPVLSLSHNILCKLGILLPHNEVINDFHYVHIFVTSKD